MNYNILESATRAAANKVFGAQLKSSGSQIITTDAADEMGLRGLGFGSTLDLTFTPTFTLFDFFSSDVVITVNLPDNSDKGSISVNFGLGCSNVEAATKEASLFLKRDALDGWYIKNRFDEFGGLHIDHDFDFDPDGNCDLEGIIASCLEKLLDTELAKALAPFIHYFETPDYNQLDIHLVNALVRHFGEDDASFKIDISGKDFHNLYAVIDEYIAPMVLDGDPPKSLTDGAVFNVTFNTPLLPEECSKVFMHFECEGGRVSVTACFGTNRTVTPDDEVGDFVDSWGIGIADALSRRLVLHTQFYLSTDDSLRHAIDKRIATFASDKFYACLNAKDKVFADVRKQFGSNGQ